MIFSTGPTQMRQIYVVELPFEYLFDILVESDKIRSKSKEQCNDDPKQANRAAEKELERAVATYAEDNLVVVRVGIILLPIRL